MKIETIVYCVVALILGMLIANMLQNVCGCKIVEGAVLGGSVNKHYNNNGSGANNNCSGTNNNNCSGTNGWAYLDGAEELINAANIAEKNNANFGAGKLSTSPPDVAPTLPPTTTLAIPSATVNPSTIFSPRVTRARGFVPPPPTATDYAAAEAAEAAEVAAQQLEDQRRFCECMDGQYSMGNRNLGSNNRRADLVCNAMMRQYGRPDGHVGKTLCGTANGETILF